MCGWAGWERVLAIVSHNFGMEGADGGWRGTAQLRQHVQDAGFCILPDSAPDGVRACTPCP